MKAPRPWLVVTDDGRRPWHRMFRVRDLGDGRRIAYWWGQFADINQRNIRGSGIFRAASYRIIVDLRATPRLKHLRLALNLPGEYFPERDGAGAHPGKCNAIGFIGIAWLPDPPNCWRPTAIWPGWKHLAHVHGQGGQMQRTWDWLEGATDEALVEVLEGA